MAIVRQGPQPTYDGHLTPNPPMGGKHMTRAFEIALDAVKYRDDEKIKKICRYLKESPHLSIEDLHFKFADDGALIPVFAPVQSTEIQ